MKKETVMKNIRNGRMVGYNVEFSGSQCEEMDQQEAMDSIKRFTETYLKNLVKHGILFAGELSLDIFNRGYSHDELSEYDVEAEATLLAPTSMEIGEFIAILNSFGNDYYLEVKFWDIMDERETADILQMLQSEYAIQEAETDLSPAEKAERIKMLAEDIDKALDEGDKPLFEKLSKEYAALKKETHI